MFRSHVVYLYKCQCCGALYVCQTRRHIHTRISEPVACWQGGGGGGRATPPQPADNSWGAQKLKGGADPAPNFESGWEKTHLKKKCVYRLINRLSA